MEEEESTSPKPPKSSASPADRLLMRQANMNRMLWALTPILAAGVYFFGWRVLGLVAACTLAPLTPFWIAVVGAVVAILFGKEVFGGFGRNFANPAIVGRGFV